MQFDFWQLEPALVLALAAWLDYLIGDPWGWPHPVQLMGWVIDRLSKYLIQILNNPITLRCIHFTKKIANLPIDTIAPRCAGIVLGIILVMGSALLGWLIVEAAKWLHPLLGIAVTTVILASCFAGKSLRDAAEKVLQPLTSGDLSGSRSSLSQYVGRDTDKLAEPEILRSVLETVTENATDGVMAPLFYAILGAFLPIVGSVPLALAYKAASTLDSTIGYREAPYTYIGWFSAKQEDVLTWLPCRFLVITLAVISGRPRYVWQMCLRDAPSDPSPNSGWSECVYAAILGVQVGGTNWYRGVAKHKPLLGDPINPITPDRIRQAMQLTRCCFLIWLCLALTALSLRTIH
ncbi:adenosylcobinamide-phosphate synthase CbiB [Aerosakkonema funiforme]|uniref:adenosylcobinamide-phosphate synthase CbiB n=1 Tax=Aerosakkonema funiforme TaxID=1246630 RepID=UPI0035BB626A